MTRAQGPRSRDDSPVDAAHHTGPEADGDGPDPSAADTVVLRVRHPHPRRQSSPRNRWRTAAIAGAAILAVVVPTVLISTGDHDDVALVGPSPTTAPEPVIGPGPTGEAEPSASTQTSPAAVRSAAATDQRSAQPGSGSPGAPTPGWTLVAQDGFAGSRLSREHWFPYTGRTAGDVGQYLASNLSVADGVLTVTGQDGNSGGVSWAPGQLYGRWEVRARTDRGTGYGPVILLWPDAEDWPEGGEVNMMEVPLGSRTQSHFTVHYGSDNSKATAGISGDFTRWTTYAVEWTPSYVAGFVNGREVFRTTDPATIPPRPMHLAIQQDVGPFEGWIPAPDASTPAQVKLQVDWVRIYRR